MNGPRRSIAIALERETVIWLSSIRPDGRPHVVPLWFLWDRESILVFSKPHAQKVRNLLADPRVMVAVGQPGADFDVELIEATAELAPVPTCRLVPGPFARKYLELIVCAGSTLDRYAELYSQPIRIQPIRWLGWGGRGWVDIDNASGPARRTRRTTHAGNHGAPGSTGNPGSAPSAGALNG